LQLILHVTFDLIVRTHCHLQSFSSVADPYLDFRKAGLSQIRIVQVAACCALTAVNFLAGCIFYGDFNNWNR